MEEQRAKDIQDLPKNQNEMWGELALPNCKTIKYSG